MTDRIEKVQERVRSWVCEQHRASRYGALEGVTMLAADLIVKAAIEAYEQEQDEKAKEYVKWLDVGISQGELWLNAAGMKIIERQAIWGQTQSLKTAKTKFLSLQEKDNE